MAVVIVVILHELLVLQVAVLLLNGVQLVTESKVVFVTLLDLEDLCLELRNEQVLLVGCEVHGVVVLKKQVSQPFSFGRSIFEFTTKKSI